MQNCAYSIWNLQLTEYLEKDMGCRFRFLLLYRLQYDSAAYTNNSTALSKQSCSCFIFNFATLYHLLLECYYMNNSKHLMKRRNINTMYCSRVGSQHFYTLQITSFTTHYKGHGSHSSFVGSYIRHMLNT